MEKLITTFVLVSRQETQLPAQCYAKCDNCLEIAIENGKAANCPDNSPFSLALSECKECIAEYTGGTIIVDDILPSISSFISYCANAPITSTVSASSLNESSIAAALSSLSAAGASISFAEQSLTSKEGNATSTSSGLDRSQICSNIAADESQIGSSVDFNVCVGATSSYTTSSIPSATSLAPATLAPATTGTNKGTGSNKGPVIGAAVGGSVGGVALFALFALSIFFMLRRRQKRRRSLAMAESSRGEEKAQLHSDDIKPDRKELEGDKVPPRAGWSDTLAELPSNIVQEQKRELPANEPFWSEMESPNVVNIDSQATTEAL